MWVAASVRIEGLSKQLHGIQILLPKLSLHKIDLLRPDSVLSTDAPAEFDAFFQNGLTCLQGLIQATADGEWIVRYAVTVGLERRLLKQDCTTAQINTATTALQMLSGESEDVKVVRARALLALRRVSNG